MDTSSVGMGKDHDFLISPEEDSSLTLPRSKEALPEGEASECRASAEGHSLEATGCPAWGMGVTAAEPGPGGLDSPKAKVEKFQEASQSFHWASIWLQSRARRPDKPCAGRRQKRQAWAASRKATLSASIHMGPRGGAGTTWDRKAL